MPQLKIDIVANAREALKNIDAVTESTDKLRKAVATAGNKDALNGGVISAETQRAADAYIARLNRLMKLSGDYVNDSKAARKATQLLASEFKKLYTITNTDAMGGFFDDNLDEIQKYIDALERAEAEQKKLAEETKTKNQKSFYELTGDEVGLLKMQLSEYEKQLKVVIATQGADSAKAKELAKAYKEQREQLDALNKQTTDFPTRIRNLIKSFVSAQAILYVVQKAFTTVTRTIKEASEQAAIAEETANLFNTTFSRVASSANNAAVSMASSLGLSITTAQQALGTFGDLAMGYGETQSAALGFAKQATQTGLDIISFKNIAGDTTEILQAMASGLAGNFENFRKWGIIVTQAEINARLAADGYDKLSGSALQFAKIQETLAIVQEKSANATGDMAKTLDSTANVSRRVEEANQQLLSNMGKSINNVLTPLKEAWLKIAESINKANLAQEQYANGQKNIKVYDIANNPDDRKSFKNSILDQSMVSTLDLFNPNPGVFSYFLADENMFLDQAAKSMTKFGATANDVIDILKEYNVSYSRSIETTLRGIDAQLTKERELELATERRNAQYENEVSTLANILDALNAIDGVNAGINISYLYNDAVTDRNTANDENMSAFLTEVSDVLYRALQNSLSSLSSSDWEIFVDPIQKALGEATEVDGLERQLKAVETLYQEISNTAIRKGIDATEILSEVASVYGEIAGNIERITEEEQRRASLTNTMDSFSSQLGSLKTSTSQLGMSDREKALDDLSIALESSMALLNAESSTYAEELADLNSIFSDLVTATNAYYDAIEENRRKEEKALKEQERQARVAQSYESIMTSALDVSRIIGELDMSDREKELDDIRRSFRNAMQDLDKDSATYSEELKKLTDATEFLTQKTNEYYDALGQRQKIEAFNNALEDSKAQLGEWTRKASNISVTEYQAAMNEIALGRANALSSASSDSDRAKINTIYNDIETQIKKYFGGQAVNASTAFRNALSSPSNKTYTTSLYSYNNTAVQTAFNDAMVNGLNALEELRLSLIQAGWEEPLIESIMRMGRDRVKASAEGAARSAQSSRSQAEKERLVSSILSSLGEVGDLVNAFDYLNISAGKFYSMLISLASETELVRQATTMLSDAIVPVLDAFLEPMLPVLDMVTSILQELVYDLLNPFYTIMLSLSEILTAVLDILTPVLEVIGTISDMLGDFLYPTFQMLSTILIPILELVAGVCQILEAVLVPVLNILKPILDALAKAFIYVYAVISVVVNFIVDAFKWVAGNVVSFFTDMYNNVVRVLKSINIFGWRPFGGMKEYDNAWAKEWGATDVFGNVEKNWNDALSLLDDINKSNMEIADNTSNSIDLSVYDDLLDKGIISANEYMAMVAEALGKSWGSVGYIKTPGGSYVDYAQNTSGGANVYYGDTTIIVEGSNLSAEEIANTIYRKLEERDRAGAAVFATY